MVEVNYFCVFWYGGEKIICMFLPIYFFSMGVFGCALVCMGVRKMCVSVCRFISV